MKHNLLFSLTAAACLSTLSAMAQVYPSQVVSYTVGDRADHGPVKDIRQNANNALGAPQDDDNGNMNTETAESINYVSLGFAGQLVLRTATPFGPGAGDDIRLVETSYGTPSCSSHPEMARVELSQDGMNWVQAGSGCHDYTAEFPINLAWAQFIRITDISDRTQFGDEQDGWDVDGIQANYAYTPPPNGNGPCPGGNGNTVVSFVQGKQKNGNAIPAARSNGMMAQGFSTGSDNSATPINFASLGFDDPRSPALEGQMVIEFGFTVFNGTGADLKALETTYGDNSSKSVASYPEIALFEGSNDGISWTILNNVNEPGVGAGQLCRDGFLDISSMPVMNGVQTLRFVRITDQSIKSSANFPGDADAYDVDAIIAINCLATARMTSEEGNDNTPIGESSLAINASVAPNPVHGGSKMTVSFDVVHAGNHSIDMFDLAGKKVMNIAEGNFSEGANSVDFNVKAVKTGMYIIRIAGASAASSSAIRVSVID